MGGLKCCQKYLWRSSFDSKVAGYKPANLAKMNFFTYIFQGFYLDFKLCAFSRNHFMERCFTFQWGVCLSDEGSFTFKWGGVHPMAGASVLMGGFQKNCRMGGAPPLPPPCPPPTMGNPAYKLLFCWKITNCCHHCFPQQCLGRVIWWDKLLECIFENFEFVQVKLVQFQNFQTSQGWFIPKIACLVTGYMLLVHFTLKLIFFNSGQLQNNSINSAVLITWLQSSVWLYILWDYSSVRIGFITKQKLLTLLIV